MAKAVAHTSDMLVGAPLSRREDPSTLPILLPDKLLCSPLVRAAWSGKSHSSNKFYGGELRTSRNIALSRETMPQLPTCASFIRDTSDTGRS